MAELVVTEGENVGTKLALQKVTCFGRGLEMDVCLDDLTVSKRHARVLRSDRGEYILEDLGSSNGTFLNGAPVVSHALHNGDEIRVGSTVFRFVDSRQVERGQSPERTLLDIRPQEVSNSSVISSVDARYETTIFETGEETGIDDLVRTNSRLRTMLDISQAIGTGLDEEDLLRRILDSLFSVFPDGHRGFIILRDPDSGKLTPAATKVGASAKGDGAQRLQISATILEYVLKEKRAVLSRDALSDERFTSSESIMEIAMRSVMCAPLMCEGEVLGFILLDAQRISRSFDEEGLTLLAGIANQAALSIANARLHKRLVTQERLDRDLRNARRIQSSFLPDEPPRVPGYRFVNWYGAALEVGGDFFDFIELPGGRVVVVVGDVSGKGITAALMMAKMTTNVRFFAGTLAEPGVLLHKLNEVALRSATDMFVTVLIMALDYEDHTIHIANAGHCHPMVLRANGVAERLECESGFPVGIAEQADFPESVVSVEPGDVLCAFTDGIIEAMSESNEQFGYGRLGEALKAGKGSPDQAVKQVQRAIRNHAGSAAQSDDLTLVCLGRDREGAGGIRPQ